MSEIKTTAIEIAADLVGVPAIADACGISVQAVYKWLRKGQAPEYRCEAISRATDGRVSTFDLLPARLRAVMSPVKAQKPPDRPYRKPPSVSNLK